MARESTLSSWMQFSMDLFFFFLSFFLLLNSSARASSHRYLTLFILFYFIIQCIQWFCYCFMYLFLYLYIITNIIIICVKKWYYTPYNLKPYCERLCDATILLYKYIIHMNYSQKLCEILLYLFYVCFSEINATKKKIYYIQQLNGVKSQVYFLVWMEFM